MAAASERGERGVPETFGGRTIGSPEGVDEHRVIFHSDMNAFYASVEQAERPELRGVPLVVGGHEELRHGIVLAKSALAKAAGVNAVTYDVTYFPHADEAEVDYQLRQLSRDLEISPEVIRDVCAAEIQEYLALDAKRDAGLPVHSIVEAYVGGTAVAWYGMNDYPRLKRVILRKLAQGGQKAKHNFIMRASKAQVDLLEDY